MFCNAAKQSVLYRHKCEAIDENIPIRRSIAGHLHQEFHHNRVANNRTQCLWLNIHVVIFQFKVRLWIYQLYMQVFWFICRALRDIQWCLYCCICMEKSVYAVATILCICAVFKDVCLYILLINALMHLQ